MTDQTTQLLQAADPARKLATAELDLRAELDLERIMTGSRPRRRPSRRLVLVASVAAVGAAVAGGRLVVTHHEAAVAGRPLLRYTQTDNRPARQQLLDFAARVRALAPEKSGRVLQVRTAGFGLSGAEGKGLWLQDFDWDTYVQGGRRYSYSDGRLSDASEAYWPKGVSSDPTVLRQQLAIGHPGARDTPSSLYDAILDFGTENRPQPAVRAALLTVLADVPGISADGSTTDRLGRPALGFSIKTSNSTNTLLFAPATGELFGYESVLTKNTLVTKFELPAMIESRALVQRYVATLPR